METFTDKRVLVLMPTPRDGERTGQALSEAGLDCAICEDIAQLCHEIEVGAGAALLVEEAIDGDQVGRLRETLRAQPPWSDFPLVVLARQGAADAPLREEMNATLVELPTKLRSLLSVVRAALRSRRRQYEVRDHLEERRRAAEAQSFLTTLADALRPLSNPEAIQGTASRILGERLRANRVAYFEVQGTNYVVERDFADGVESLVGRYSVASFGEALMQSFLEGRTVVEADAVAVPARSPAERAAFAAIQVRGHVDVPLVKAGSFVAGMTVHLRDARDWTAEEVGIIEQTAERTWAAVEQAKAEAALRASEERFRAWVTASSDAVYRLSADWSEMRFLQGRDSVADIREPSRRWLQEFVHPDDREHIAEIIREALRTRGVFESEHRVLRADGSTGWTFTRAVPLLDAHGEVVEWFGAAQDVTEHKQAEDDLRDIRSRMEAALVAGAIGTWAWDVPNDRFYGDPSLASIFNVPLSAVAGGPLAGLMDSIHSDDQDQVSRLVNQALESGGRYEADYRVTDGAGGWRWVNARGQVERDESGAAARFPGVVIEVTGRKRAEEALDRVTAESERRTRLYEAVLSTTPDLAYVWGLDHRFTYANEGLLRMWGKTWDEAIGKNCLELGYEPWHAEMHDREIEEVRTTRKPLRGEVPFAGTFGRRIYDYILMPVIGADGEVEAVAGTTRDVTDRKAMEQELRDADRKKSDFIALLAHELRNPLAPIRNGLHVLRLAGTDQRTAEKMREMMERQLTHMVRLIDDLLDVSRINHNKMELRISQVTLREAVNSALETARPMIDAGEHTLTVSLPDQPIYFEADLTRLAQVFSNLLSNSAKYTPRGGDIRLTAERRGRKVAITVRDDGIGIPAGSLANIFDMFSQVDRGVERATGGLGIGLALVKGLVEMHGGTIVAESAGEDKGSAFTVTLPVIATRESTSSEAKMGRPPEIGRRILVVDDSPDSAESLAQVLTLMGNHVRTAHDGNEGAEAAEEFRPEIVLMDIGMPVLNGLDATRRIRGHEWGRNMMIIALTGWGQEDDKERSREAGCDGHLVKPVNIDELKKLLGKRRA